MEPAGRPIQYWEFRQENWNILETKVITETPMSLTVNGELWLTFMCTPSDLEALAVGFLYNEGIIQSFDEVASVRVCEQGDNVDVWLYHLAEKPSQWRRTSGCTGGISSVSEQSEQPRHRIEGARINPAILLETVEQLFKSQALYREARGVHCSVISDGPSIYFFAEDIGRHNTIDKLSGLYLMQGQPAISPLIVATTGRISSEMLQKSAQLGAAVVISRTSPTTLSVASANRLGITLIGYARRNQFNVYTHPERLIGAQQQVDVDLGYQTVQVCVS